MNILFRAIKPVKIDVESSYERFVFYQDHYYDNIYIFDNNGCLLGYTNYFLESVDGYSLRHDFLPVNCEVKDVYQWFNKNAGQFRVPVTLQSKLVGEYYDSDADGVCLYQSIENKAIELSELYKKELQEWASNKNILILSSDTDKWNKVHELIPNSEWSTSHTARDKYTHVIDLNLCTDFRNRIKLNTSNTLSMSEIIMPIMLKRLVSYFNKKSVGFYVFDCIRKSEIDWLTEKEQLNSAMSIEEVLQDADYLKRFTGEDIESFDFISKHRSDLNQLAIHISNGIHNVLVDREEKHLHIISGIRHTVDQPQSAHKNIHLYGPCVVYGLCVADSQTIPSHLQKLIIGNSQTDIKVINHGLSYGKDLLNDLLYMMATPVSSGDKIVWLSGFMKNEITLLKSLGVTVHSLKSEVLNLRNWFLNNPFHCNSMVNKIYAKEIHRIITGTNHDCVSSEKRSMIEELKIPLHNDPDAILNSDRLSKYVKFLESNRIEDANAIKGCVVMNANPCTKGHIHLITEALKEVDYLYVFLVQENMVDGYSYLDRKTMLKQNLKDVPNIILLPGGNVFTSFVGFPEYFNRNSSYSINPILNHRIFCEKIAKVLDIKVRFFGEEDNDTVTLKLNETALQFFPKFGIKVKIIPRLKYEKTPVSAKDVRKYIKSNQYDRLIPLVTKSTLDYLIRIK